MPDNAKDVIIAILGSSVGLAGLLLVFSGFVFTQAAGFPRETTDDATINRFRNVGRLGLVPFVLSLLISGLSFAWLVKPETRFYCLSVIGFAVVLIGTAIYAIVVLGFYL